MNLKFIIFINFINISWTNENVSEGIDTVISKFVKYEKKYRFQWILTVGFGFIFWGLKILRTIPSQYILIKAIKNQGGLKNDIDPSWISKFPLLALPQLKQNILNG